MWSFSEQEADNRDTEAQVILVCVQRVSHGITFTIRLYSDGAALKESFHDLEIQMRSCYLDRSF